MYRRCGFRYEKKLRAIGVARIAGIDEAGRGALAGPVVAAAVVLPEKFRHRRLNDSKQLAPELREEIYCELVANPEAAIIDGDCISLSVAAASVIAKVTRDRMMRDFCAQFPQYSFSQHKGYGTELHLLKLHEFGPCPIHRRSFEPVAQPLLALEELVKISPSPARRSRREIGVSVPAA